MPELKIADTRAGKRPKREDEPIPDVDESVRKEARNVGLLAVLFAAGISAQALYALGLLIGLSPWTAWMLPGAMDLYAFESTRVASRVPARHPSRSWAVWNARLALFFTVTGNALFHALHLAGAHRGWTNTDIALTAVSAVPPVIVERFLHLQTKINVVANPATATPPATGNTTPKATQATVAPAATPPALPVATPQATPAEATLPAMATPAAKTTPTRPAAPAGNTPIRLITAAEKDAIVARMLEERGDDVPLSEIATAIGTKHRATAMKVRDRVIEARAAGETVGTDDPEDAADEPEPALGAAV